VSNLRFISTKLEQITFTSSVGDNASYPASNLNTGFHDDIWKSADSNNAQFLTLDFGVDVRDRTGIVLHNHNLGGIMSSGALKLQGANNSGFSSGVIDGLAAFDPTTDPYFYNFGGTADRQYWRILFNGALNAIPQIGQVFVDYALDLGTVPSLPYEPGVDEHIVTRTVSLDSRIRASSPYGARRTWRISLKEGNALSDAIRTNWQTVFAIAGGSLRPVYMIDDLDGIYLGHFDFDKDTLQKLRYNLFPLEIIFRAQRAS